MTKRVLPLSSAQLRMLEDVVGGRSPYARIFGASAHGGATSTLDSLIRRGLVVQAKVGGSYTATEAGKAALA